MKKSLLLLCLLAVMSSAAASDVLKVKVISADRHRSVGFATLKVEYPDTIVDLRTDRKGKLKFSPSSFPLTVTVSAPGMTDATFGLMSMPEKGMTLELYPDPSAPAPVMKRRVDWSSAWPRRLSSTYIVRTPAPR